MLVMLVITILWIAGAVGTMYCMLRTEWGDGTWLMFWFAVMWATQIAAVFYLAFKFSGY